VVSATDPCDVDDPRRGVDAEEYAARAVELGYTVAVGAGGYVDFETGEAVPAVYRVAGFGLSTMFRGDDADVWTAIVSAERHRLRREALAGERATVLPPFAPASVAGPVPATPPGDGRRDYPQMSSYLDLDPFGYVEEEFFVAGTATSVAIPAVDGSPVRPAADAVALSTGHPYRTRIVVRRPTDPASFNGTAVVDWLNVTAFSNVDHLWLEAGSELMRQGYAYVGVSAQRAGVHSPRSGLRAWSPVRYASLDVTDAGALADDSLCFDIFAQVGLALRQSSGTRLLGTLEPRLLIAYGASQSNRQLVAFHNAVHSLAPVYDGYLLATGRAVGPLRDDVDTKVFRVNSETDVVAGGYLRLPDSDRLRTWEVAGTSHTTYQLAQARAVLERRGDIAPLPYSLSELPPLSRIPLHHATVAAIAQLERWVADGREPARAPQLELTSSGPSGSVAARDSLGNALGGLRL
jgi:hypothetical protein